MLILDSLDLLKVVLELSLFLVLERFYLLVLLLNLSTKLNKYFLMLNSELVIIIFHNFEFGTFFLIRLESISISLFAESELSTYNKQLLFSFLQSHEIVIFARDIFL